MKDLLNNENLIFNSGIYYNSKECRRLINIDTKRKTFKKRMITKLRDKHFMENKIKVAASIFIAVLTLSLLLIG